MTAMDYYKVLQTVHRLVNPRTYVEIGVRHGESWQLVAPTVKSIGIDPAPSIRFEPAGQAQLFEGTSDEFFAQYPPAKAFAGAPVDLAFIDGMHLFEYALRDFLNLEKYCTKDSCILVHDCLPIDAATSARDRTTSVWSGDVWKLIVCLQKERPDLRIDVVDTAPTGLAIISNLDPSSTVLSANYEQLKDFYVPLPYEVLGTEEQKHKQLNVCAPTDGNLARLCTRPRSVASNQRGTKGETPARKPALATTTSTATPRKLGVLLCYNDADILVDVLDHMLANGHDLLIWDHGSSDATPDILSHYKDAIVAQKQISREVDFYGLYHAMSKTLINDWIGKYDWISWPDQDEILEGANRQSSYADQVHKAFAEGSDWIAFNNINYWWTAQDLAMVQSPVRRIRHYGIFPDCSPRIRSWRASKTNVREFNHNALDGKKHPENFNLRHYPMRSEAQAQQRITRDRAGLQRGTANYHYNNMAKHPQKLIVDAAMLHHDDGVAELNLACHFDWRTIYGGLANSSGAEPTSSGHQRAQRRTQTRQSKNTPEASL